MIGRLLGWLMPYAWPLVAAAGLALVAALGWQTVQLAKAERNLAQEQRGRAQDRADAEAAARIASENYRREEQRRETAKQEAIHAAEQKAAQARADLAIADAAAGRLRERVAALVAAAREAASNPGAVQPSAPAADAAMVLADVFGRCITRVRELASLADQRGNAGSTCQLEYDSLTPPAPIPLEQP